MVHGAVVSGHMDIEHGHAHALFGQSLSVDHRRLKEPAPTGFGIHGISRYAVK
jgi:hypothetical protein